MNIKQRLDRIEAAMTGRRYSEPTPAEIAETSQAVNRVIEAKLARACGQDVPLPDLTPRQQYVNDWISRTYAGEMDGARARLERMLDRRAGQSAAD